jgi:oxygen-independent coproporphyrinogen-3 oxidase
MVEDSDGLSEESLVEGIKRSRVTADTTFQIYLHIPFCAQRCSFCAFSGGNSLEFKKGKIYIDTLITQLKRVLNITPVYGQKRVRSVHIGGGSPDLVRSSIGNLLEEVRNLKGVDDLTEIAIECAPATTRTDFLEECVKHKVTKLSFGIQSINPDIRHSIRMPRSLKKVEDICAYVAGSIPVVNADFITGLPGQTLSDVDSDLEYVLDHQVINAMSTYLLTPGAAPSLVADVKRGWAPQVPSHKEQALMRLHSYTTMQQAGWVRKGTNTYMNPKKIQPAILETIPGNECIGAAHFDTFLIAAGAQAIGSVPGVRFENTVNIDSWLKSVSGGDYGFNSKKSALSNQEDMSLWTFPLFYQGLEKDKLNELISSKAVSNAQVNMLNDLISEGLIVEKADKYALTILGEVFMGHIVKLLKKEEGQKVLDDYIAEGFLIGDAINDGLIKQENSSNDRQTVLGKI